MRFFRKLFVFFIIFILAFFTICFIIGYNAYSKALEEKPLITRIDEVTKKENYVSFKNLPKNYINAVIAVEDHRFYNHGPIDVIGIGRALWVNLKSRGLQQGGSTITQQVAKNLVFSQEDSFERKLGEFFAAYEIEKNYNKDEILAIYANTCYFGDGYYGIYDASMGYYNKKPKDLNLNEASMLAGIPNAPSVYSPNVNPDLAKKRQQHVLSKMIEYGYISKEEATNI